MFVGLLSFYWPHSVFGAEETLSSEASVFSAELASSGLEVDQAAEELADRLAEGELAVPGLIAKPRADELKLASAMAAWTFLSSLPIWMVTEDMGFSHALGTAGYQGLVTLGLMGGVRTFDNLFARSWLNPSKRFSRRTEFLLRFMFNWGLLQALRAVTGPIGATHAVDTVQGQIEIAQNQLVVGTGASLVSEARNRKFLRKRMTNAWTNFNLFMMLAPISLADFAGLYGARLAAFELVGTQVNVNLSTVLVLASYIGTAVALEKWPRGFRRLALWQEKKLRNFGKKLRSAREGLRGRCRSVFGRVVSLSR